MLQASRHTAAVAAFVVCASLGAAQVPLTRFFMLPDTGPAPGSDSMFTGLAGATRFAFDFSEALRFNRGGFVTLGQNAGNPFAWDVLDFELPATDLALGSQLMFERPAGPGPHGTWTSSYNLGFADFSTVTVSMTGALTATGPLAGAFPSMATLTLTGVVTPGYYHNVLPLTGSFTGIAGTTVSLFMKNDFFPPAVIWEMVVDPSNSTALAPAGAGPAAIQGGVSMQRGIATPNAYSLLNLAMDVAVTPPVAITTPAGQSAGTLTFNPATRVVTGSLSVLIDGIPATIPVDGIGDSFSGSALRPVAVIINQSGSFGPLNSLSLQIAATELVPTDPPTNDFQIGVMTALLMRGRAGRFYGCGASFTPVPGINTPVGDIAVMGDDLLTLSLDPLNPFFLNMTGIMPPSGEVMIGIFLPFEPVLIGATFFLGGATLNLATLDVMAATNSHRAIIK